MTLSNMTVERMNFCYCFKVENLKLLPGSYHVCISRRNIANFSSLSNSSLNYFIALISLIMNPTCFFGLRNTVLKLLRIVFSPRALRKSFKDFWSSLKFPIFFLQARGWCWQDYHRQGTVCETLGTDYLVINGSDEGRFLDTVRNQAKVFASTVSLTSTAKHKVIIIDEADNTTPDVQMLLRACIEEFQKNCRFIFTCNYKNKIISLCTHVALLLTSPSRVRRKQQWQEHSSTVLKLF